MKPFPKNRYGAALLCLSLTLPAAAADLQVLVRGVKPGGGAVMAAVFNDPTSFPSKYLVGQKVEPAAGEVTVVFHDLAPGAYAVSVYQDADGNGKLTRNFVGLPTEPYGFSRNARGTMGPPSFDDAKLDLGAAGAETTVNLK